MEPRIETLPETKLIGQRVEMSYAHNKTKELWQSFMPKLSGVENKAGTELYSVEVYPDTEFFKNFDPSNKFEKWAAIEVKDFTAVPDGMETLEVPEGLYAVFHYKGSSAEARQVYQYIYGNWIPNSEYQLDDRPHFALMGEKYKTNDPDSEEELWIPVKAR